jgi:hypothetical protein
MCSDFIIAQATRKPSFCHSLHFLWCTNQRSLYVITKVYYRSMSCFATVSPTVPSYSAKVSPIDPSCTMWAWAKSQAISHWSEQDTEPIVLLISKQAASYRTHGGTYCSGVSTPKIHSLADSSTTCHDSINHLHHSNHCSNHSIDPHTINSHLDGWETTSLTLRHMPNLTS